MHKIPLEEEVVKEEEISKEKGMIFIAYDVIEMDMMLPHVRFLGIEQMMKEMKKKVKHLIKGKENHPSRLIMLLHIATLV